MIWRWVMSWFTPCRPRAAHLDAAVNEALLAGNEAEKAAEDMTALTEAVEVRARGVALEAAKRLERQEARRQAREKAARERGIVSVVDDLLQLQSFGGSGERKS
jgi:hypothetical protein